MASINADTYKKVEGATQDLKNKAMDKVGAVEDQFDKYGQDVAKRVESFANTSLDLAKDYAKTGREFVKSNPTKGIAIAAAAGLVAGGLLSFIMRRRH